MSRKIAMTLEAREGYEMLRLQQLIRDHGFEPVFYDHLSTDGEVIEKLKDCDAVIAGGDEYNRHVLSELAKAGRLKIIARFGVGFDKVDLEAASEFGIAVTNTAGTMSMPVAELTMTLILSTARSIAFCDRKLREDGWFTGPAKGSLDGKTVGLVGFGAIAKKLAEYLSGFHCRILAYDICFDREAAGKLGVEQATIEEIAAESDFVSLHTPKTPETVGMWNKRLLAMMKPTAFLINTSRGDIVNERDLIWALENRVICGAGLDVFEEEPLPKDSPLLKMDNVILIPHNAGWNDQSELVTGGRALENIIDLFEGRRPRNILNPDYASHISGQKHVG
ncbi:phosphoglycerate dehydrogenase [Ruminococcus gauvreauii]|uniref:Phosphoglycerate dehydrogenase n=1 Tax=Ruminococcus gauvreauii TaxID=438033 RepID=A0ABY5VFG6_9FIRM|nr:phosphoglycerate dehydrogenase [Ruminococcus gauvreauii]UWP58978.1 phosphoglycerate dehydrogenase [Ruminococcus gauvreauii]